MTLQMVCVPVRRVFHVTPHIITAHALSKGITEPPNQHWYFNSVAKLLPSRHADLFTSLISTLYFFYQPANRWWREQWGNGKRSDGWTVHRRKWAPSSLPSGQHPHTCGSGWDSVRSRSAGPCSSAPHVTNGLMRSSPISEVWEGKKEQNGGFVLES